MARPARAREARWRSAVAVLDSVRAHPGATRAAVARRLGLSSGSATEITARLRDLDLLAEAPLPAAGRGRPTAVLGPHPRGPLVVAVDLRQEDWRCAVAAVDGRPQPVAAGRHVTREPAAVLDAVRRAIRPLLGEYGYRVRAVGVAVAGTVRDGSVVQAATLGWQAVDLAPLAERLPLVVGNDARLAGVAEARGGAAVGAAASLHVTVEVGVGGSLVVDGQPVTGATGAAGEFGHLPFGDPALRCPCGARGCWDLDVDGRALARHLGAPPPDDPRTYARSVLARAGGDPLARAAVARAATGLGAGIAGLVNALDPEVVTLGGLAEPLRAAAPDAFATAFRSGLMAFRRAAPPAVVAAAFGEDGALHGAAATALDRVVSEAGLASWVADRS